MSPYLVTFSVGWFARLLIRDVSSFLLPAVRRVLGVADGGVDGEAPGWGAGISLRSQCPCPVTLMGADGSKNRNVSTFFFFFLNAQRDGLPPSPWDVFYSTGLQPCNSWINCVESHSTWSSKISVWTIGELDTLQHMHWCWKPMLWQSDTLLCPNELLTDLFPRPASHWWRLSALSNQRCVPSFGSHDKNILHGWLHSSCTTLLQICCAAQGEGVSVTE